MPNGGCSLPLLVASSAFAKRGLLRSRRTNASFRFSQKIRHVVIAASLCHAHGLLKNFQPSTQPKMVRLGGSNDHRGQSLLPLAKYSNSEHAEDVHAISAMRGGGLRKRNHWTDTVELGAYVFLWFVLSAVCTNTSKQLDLHWALLTLVQFLISSVCGVVGILSLELVPFRGIESVEQFKMTSLVAMSFLVGFATLNWALNIMHVSLVMTLRSMEPLTTVFLCATFLHSEKVTKPMVLSLLPVVIGVGLSSAESAEFGMGGLLLVVVCNLMFSLRGVATKRLKSKYNIDDFNLFLQVSVLGALMQAAALGVAWIFEVAPSVQTKHLRDHTVTTLLLVNGISFFAHSQLSWVVLTRVSAVTHSVCNSIRRPVMSIAGVVQFGNHVSLLNAAGMVLASLGTLVYTQVNVGLPAMDAVRLFE